MASSNSSNTDTSTTITTDIQPDQQDRLDDLECSNAEKQPSLTNKFTDFSNSIVQLNVGGKKVSTSRKILTMIEGTLLSTLFSGQLDETLIKDVDGAYFFDYDPVLFKHLINQLRYWSLNSLVTRVLVSPRDLENEFISLVRCLKFDESFLSDTFSEKVNSNVQIVDNQRLCVKTGEDQHCAYITGNLLYFQGKHIIKLMSLLTKQRIGFIGIRPANLPIQVNSSKNYLPIPCTFRIDNNCVVVNGQCALIGQAWTTVCPTNNFRIELDCDSRTMHITRRQSFNQNEFVCTRFIDLTSVPFPWQLFIVLKDKNDYFRLLL